jgi:hypothetical protein
VDGLLVTVRYESYRTGAVYHTTILPYYTRTILRYETFVKFVRSLTSLIRDTRQPISRHCGIAALRHCGIAASSGCFVDGLPNDERHRVPYNTVHRGLLLLLLLRGSLQRRSCNHGLRRKLQRIDPLAGIEGVSFEPYTIHDIHRHEDCRGYRELLDPLPTGTGIFRGHCEPQSPSLSPPVSTRTTNWTSNHVAVLHVDHRL